MSCGLRWGAGWGGAGKGIADGDGARFVAAEAAMINGIVKWGGSTCMHACADTGPTGAKC